MLFTHQAATAAWTRLTDGHTLGMKSTQVCVFHQMYQEVFCSLQEKPVLSKFSLCLLEAKALTVDFCVSDIQR